jgi:hypothetical protein
VKPQSSEQSDPTALSWESASNTGEQPPGLSGLPLSIAGRGSRSHEGTNPQHGAVSKFAAVAQIIDERWVLKRLFAERRRCHAGFPEKPFNLGEQCRCGMIIHPQKLRTIPY